MAAAWDDMYIKEQMKIQDTRKKVIIGLIILLWVFVFGLMWLANAEANYGEGCKDCHYNRGAVVTSAQSTSPAKESLCGECHYTQKTTYVSGLYKTAISNIKLKPKIPKVIEGNMRKIIVNDDLELVWLTDYEAAENICLYSFNKVTGDNFMDCFSYNEITYEMRQIFNK